MFVSNRMLGECAMGIASWYIEKDLCVDEIQNTLLEMRANEEYRKYFMNVTGFDWSTCEDDTPGCK